MAYTTYNFKTKKALKEAVNAYLSCTEGEVKAYQRSHRLGPDLSNYTGSIAIEGPHYPAAHTWYAACEMKDGVIVKVK